MNHVHGRCGISLVGHVNLICIVRVKGFGSYKESI